MNIMKALACICSLIVLVIVTGCARQDGSVAGTISPSGGVSVTAAQNRKTISSAEAVDGRFNLSLAPGTYDITVSSRESPFPVVFHDVRVERGKITDLSRIDIPNAAGKGALSGRVTPAVPGTAVTLFFEGRERAAANTDNQGNYRFTQLPEGSYTVRARAPAFASDAVPVSIFSEGTATRNFALFSASPIEGVDWNSGKLRVRGTGVPHPDAANPTIRHELARRAALADAARKLVKTIAEIKLGSDQSLKSRMAEKKFSQTIEGFIKGYTIIAEREREDGAIEIDVELPLTGPNGLSRHLAE